MDTPPIMALTIPLRWKCFGGRGTTCQISRIEDGLVSLGYEIVTDGNVAVRGNGGIGLDKVKTLGVDHTKVDVVYANDAERWQEAIDYRAHFAPQAKLILCCLDLAEWCYPDYNPYALHPLLLQADAVCSISQYVRSQLHRYFGMESHVIYNPIMSVSPDKRLAGERPYPQYRFLLVGRLRDPSKRANLAVQALIMSGIEEHEVAVVGSEPIGFGTHLGVVSNETLNDLYNSVDYVMCTSAAGGLELPPIESMICGALPILCSDLTTFHEGWFPRRWGCYPNAHSIAYRLRSLIDIPEILKQERQYCLDRSAGLRKQLGGEGVAARLVDVARGIIQS